MCVVFVGEKVKDDLFVKVCIVEVVSDIDVVWC